MNALTVSVMLGGLGAAVAIWPDETARTRVRVITPMRESKGKLTSLRNGKGLLVAMPLLVTLALSIGVEVSLAGVMVAWTVLVAMRGRGRRKAVEQQSMQVMRATETLSAELRAGAEAVRALRSAHRGLVAAPGVSAAQSLVADEFERAAQRAVFGAPWSDYLGESWQSVGAELGGKPQGERSVKNPDLMRLARSWQCAQRCGLPMADIIDNCRRDIAAREAFRSRTSAALAGPRMTIVILASLPVFGLLLGQAFGANPVPFLLGGGLGGMVLLTGTFLSCVGVLWSSHILSVAEVGA